MTILSLVKCLSYTAEDIDNALEKSLANLGGLAHFIKKGQRVLIKPNFLMISNPKNGAITHPQLIISVAKKVQAIGAFPFIGDSSAFNSATAVAKSSGLKEMTDKLNIPIVELTKRTLVKTSHNKRYVIDKFSREADAIINLPKLKAHCQVRYSGAVKNMFGCVPGKIKALRHFKYGRNVDKFAEMLIYNYQLVRPTLTIMDAIESMHTTGPTEGKIIQTNLLIAGSDCVSIDTLVSKLLNLPFSKNPILVAAKTLREGQTNLDNIEVIGEDINACSCDSFIWPEKLVPIRFSLPRIAKSVLKNIYLQLKEKFGK